MFWQYYGRSRNNFSNRINYTESNLSNQYNQSNRRCNCRELFSGIARDRFVKVLLKSSAPIEGFFLGIFNGIVILYDEKRGRVSSTTICCEDVVAVTSFGEKHC